MKRMLAVLIAVAFLLVACATPEGAEEDTPPPAESQDTPSATAGNGSADAEAPAELAEAGVIRVGWAEFSPYQFRDPESGDVTGLIVELWDDLASDWGLEIELVEDAWPTITTALASDHFDVTLFVDTPGRREHVDFTNPLFQAEYRLMVQADSEFQTFADVDQSGNSISVTTGSSTEEELNKAAQNAEVVSIREVAAALLQLTSGNVEGMASTTDYLLPQVENQPGLRVTEDAFALAPWSIGIQRGTTELEEALSAWVEDYKASGRMEELLEKYEMVGIFVSPPGPYEPES
jgi:ABC-type amino acid transport substrate-binding protein